MYTMDYTVLALIPYYTILYYALDYTPSPCVKKSYTKKWGPQKTAQKSPQEQKNKQTQQLYRGSEHALGQRPGEFLFVFCLLLALFGCFLRPSFLSIGFLNTGGGVYDYSSTTGVVLE